MIIDSHVHLGKSIFGYELTLEKLLSTMEEYQIDYSVICPNQPRTYHLEPENDYIASVAEAHSNLIGFARVDPRQEEKAIDEVSRAISKLGLKGVFLHPWEEGYRVNSESVVAVVEKATELGVPVMIASGYPWLSHALQVADVASEVPNATIIMTNGGQINISGMAQADAYLAMEKQPNLYVETSGVYRQDFIENCIEKFGSSRVLFGSNSPRMNQGFELERAKSATKKNSEKQKDVLGYSMARILNLV
ncbi:MAG TPA: amidohydrolase family protein [Sporolactobacillaceae bacterium]|nr:amidohydrolase family protein [Sporolactobacillaceae bacterium]